MKILVLDDDEAIRESMRNVLEDEGFIVITAGRGRDAITIGKSDRTIGLMILDIGLPDVDGWTVSRMLRRAGVTVPIYLFTGWSGLKIQEKALIKEVTGVLHKPIDLDDLLDICHVAETGA